jgi:hypothetical protein
MRTTRRRPRRNTRTKSATWRKRDRSASTAPRDRSENEVFAVLVISSPGRDQAGSSCESVGRRLECGPAGSGQAGRPWTILWDASKNGDKSVALAETRIVRDDVAFRGSVTNSHETGGRSAGGGAVAPPSHRCPTHGESWHGPRSVAQHFPGSDSNVRRPNEQAVVVLHVRHTRTGARTAGRDAGRPAPARLRAIGSPELHRSRASAHRLHRATARIHRRPPAAQPLAGIIARALRLASTRARARGRRRP